MATIQSNTDAVLVAIPMVAMLFAGFFRLDELLSKPRKKLQPGRQLSDWDENGHLICIDPDGTRSRIIREKR